MKTPMTDELDEVSCVMSDEETVKAYKKLCRKMEDERNTFQLELTAAISTQEELRAQARLWRTVAERLIATLHGRTVGYYRYPDEQDVVAAFEQAKRDTK